MAAPHHGPRARPHPRRDACVTPYPHSAPVKLFREEAQTSTVQCPGCGGPVARRGFGAIERVVCPYCGSESTPADDGALALLAHEMRARRTSVLGLHERGKLGGTVWEILGILWRQCTVDEIDYPWQELLLYNPYKGYRYLVYSMTDGHWTLGTPLDGVPQTHPGFGHKHVVWKRQRFKHFQTVVATVTYAEGEFPWQVRVGDQAIAHEYIAPPQSISVEEAYGPDGQDLNFTRMQHLDPHEVWAAFGRKGEPPRMRGIGPCRPNPWREDRGITWASLAVLLFAWIVFSIAYVGGREPRVVFVEHGRHARETISADLEITGTHPTTVELELFAYPLSNAYAYADVMLIPHASEEGIGFGITAESWSGVDGGEAWREGDPSPRVVVGGVAPGKYLLQVALETGNQVGPALIDLRYDVAVRQDVVLLRYLALPLAVILGFPLAFAGLSFLFESRRWSNSDYAGSNDD